MGVRETEGSALRQVRSLGMQREQLQVIAMLTMLIDHIGFVMFPDQLVLRMIGRIAFPLYAFGMVQGYLHTSNLKRYLQRLAVLALLSQLPYMFAFQYMRINVIGTLLICICTMYVFDKAESIATRILIITASFVFLLVVPTDYGTYALMLVFIYRYAAAKWAVFLHLLLNGYYYWTVGVLYQSLSTLSTMWLAWGPKRRPPAFHVPRWLWLSFYPAHLTLLAVIRWLYYTD